MSTPVVVVSGAGTPGPRGNGWLSGTGAPSNSIGLDGDFYIDITNSGVYYGPKTAGAWPGTTLPFSTAKTTASPTNPTVNSDNTAGYSIDSTWVNTTTSTYFVCSSAATGAAVWTPVLPVGTVASTVAAGNDTRITGALQKTNNLSDLNSASGARTNLGLGGAAILNVGTATGTVAAGDDSRITGAAQKSANLSDIASAPTARTNLGLGGAATLNVGSTTGTVAAGDDTRITGAAQKAQNLADLANPSTARTNLGLGGAATANIGTTAGTVAAGNDSRITGALQAASNLSDIASASTARTNLGLGGSALLNVGTTTGTVAAGDDSRITGAAQKAQNLSDLASAPTARTNLGLGNSSTLNVGTVTGTVAAGDDSRITGAAQKAQNLSDLSSAPTARTNLGLGGAATLNVGTVTGTVAAGDDSRITGAVQSTTLPNARASFAPHRRQPQWRQPSTIITTFQSGHGWTNNAGSTLVANDTSDFILGTQACKLTSGGTGVSANLSKTGMSTIDTTGKVIRLRIKIDDITHMTGFNFFLGSSSLANNYKWIIQGGQAGSNFVESGNWYIVTLNWHDAVTTGTPARNAITDARLQIVDDATATVTLHANSVELVNDASATFPNGVVSVTFDDSYQSVWDFGMPKLASYGYQASVYTIHDLIGTSGRFTFAELGYLQGLHGWECGSHANTDVDHSLTYTGLTSTQLDDDLANLKSWGLVSGFRGSSGTAYPLGQYGKTTDAVDTTSIVQKYFDYARTTNSKTKETFPPADPFRLRAISSISTFAGSYAPSNLTVANGDLDKAKANQTWLILVFHKIVTGTPAAATEIAQSDFNTIIDGINSRGMPVLTIGDVMRYSNSI